MVIDRQLRTRYGGIIDLCAIDADGRCVVLELKRGRTPRDVIAQSIDYVSWVAELSDADIRDRVARRYGCSFDEAYRDHFVFSNPPDELNTDQRIIIVATDIDESTTRIVQHLTARYGMDINVVALSYFIVDGQELLARTWVIDPADLEERVETRSSEGAVSEERTWTGVWHVNIGVHADDHIGRNWDDERRYGFLSAGQGARWREELSGLPVGARVYAYLNGAGYVGGGEVVSSAVPSIQFVPPGSEKPLRDLPLENQNWFANGDDPDLAEYMVGVKWNRTVSASEGVRVAPVIRGTVRKIRSPQLAATLQSAFG